MFHNLYSRIFLEAVFFGGVLINWDHTNFLHQLKKYILVYVFEEYILVYVYEEIYVGISYH